MLFHIALLKWYLEKGLEFNNITFAIHYEKRPFKQVTYAASNARRQLDVDKSYKLIDEIMKLIGNSSYGKCLANFLKHEFVKVVLNTKYSKNIRRPHYKPYKDLIEEFEFIFAKTFFKQNLPIQVEFAIYQLAKSRMLQFYYDFIDFYFNRNDF